MCGSPRAGGRRRTGSSQPPAGTPDDAAHARLRHGGDARKMNRMRRKRTKSRGRMQQSRTRIRTGARPSESPGRAGNCRFRRPHAVVRRGPEHDASNLPHGQGDSRQTLDLGWNGGLTAAARRSRGCSGEQRRSRRTIPSPLGQGIAAAPTVWKSLHESV